MHAFSPSFLEAEAEGFLSTVQTLCPTVQASIVSAEKLALGWTGFSLCIVCVLCLVVLNIFHLPVTCEFNWLRYTWIFVSFSSLGSFSLLYLRMIFLPFSLSEVLERNRRIISLSVLPEHSSLSLLILTFCFFWLISKVSLGCSLFSWLRLAVHTS